MDFNQSFTLQNGQQYNACQDLAIPFLKNTKSTISERGINKTHCSIFK